MKFFKRMIFITFLSLICVSCKSSSGAGEGFSGSDSPAPNPIQAPTYTISLSSPLINTSVNLAGPASLTVSGLCDTYTGNMFIFVSTSQVASIPCNTGSFSTSLSTGLLGQGSNTIYAYTSDLNSSASVVVNKDTVIPSLTISTPSTINSGNQNNYFLAGTCSDDGQVISGTLDVIPFTATCSSGSWISPGLNASILTDNTYTITVSMNDSVGNSSGNIVDTVLKDTTANVPIISFQTPSIGYGNLGSVTFRISNISSGDTIRSYSGVGCTSFIKQEISGATTYDMSFTNSSEGTFLFYFEVIDSGMNSSGCLGPYSFVEDQTSPNDPLTVTMTSPGDGESTSDSTPLVSGTVNSVDEGATVELFNDASCTNNIGQDTVTSSAFNVQGSLPIDGSANGFNQMYLKITDLAGNIGLCYDTGLGYTLGGGGLATLPKIAMVGATSNTYVISLADNNTITHKPVGGGSVDLGTYQTGEIVPTFTVDQGDIIESTEASYAITEGFGTAPWASEAYAGTTFSTYISRYGQYQPKVYVAAVQDDCFVQILQNGNVVDFANVTKDTIHEFTLTLTNNQAFQVIATKNINVYFVSRNSSTATYTRDARVLTPSATDIVGFSGYITVDEDSTSGNYYLQNGTTGAVNLNKVQALDLGGSTQASINRATRVVMDKPAALTQIADQDGLNAAPHLPVTMMATNFGIPRAADYVSFISLQAGTMEVFNPSGVSQGVFNLTRTTSTPSETPFSYRYRPGVNISAGHTFVCSVPCYAVYDDRGPGADDDETIMMGYTP